MAAGTRTVRIAFDGTTKGLDKATKNGAKALGGFRSSVKKVAGALAGLFAIRQTISFFGNAIKDAEAFSTAQAITNKVLEQTGGIANVSSKDVDKLTSSLARQTGVSDTLVREGSNVLLTFKNLRNEVGAGNDVFDRSNALMLDMSSVFGGDATTNAKILGKALNDPTAGVSALTRVGVTFTKEQKEQIATLQESGDTLGAQKIILAEIEGQVGGTAAASANATDKIKVVWEQVRRAIGNLLLPVLDKLAVFFDKKVAPMAAKIGPLVAELRERLAPAVRAVAGFVKDTLVPALVNLGKFIVRNKDFFIPFVAILGAALVAFKAFMFIKAVIAAVAAFNLVLAANPIGLVVVAIAALVAGLIFAWKNSETFRDVVMAVWEAIQAAISAVLSWFTDTLWPGIQMVWGLIRDSVIALRDANKAVWEAIKNAVKAAFQFVRDTIVRILTGIRDNNARIWGAIRSAISTVVGAVKTAVKVGFDLVKRFMIDPILAGRDVIKAGIDVVVGFFKGIPRRIGAALATVASMVAAPFRKAFRGIKNIWNSTVGGLGFTVPDWVPTIGGKEFRIPRLHSGGLFMPPAGHTEGLALLRRGERVLPATAADREPSVVNVNVQAWSDRFSWRQVRDELALHGVV